MVRETARTINVSLVVHLRQKLSTETWQAGQGGGQQGQYVYAFDNEGFTGYHFETEQKLPFLEMFKSLKIIVDTLIIICERKLASKKQCFSAVHKQKLFTQAWQTGRGGCQW